MHTVDDHAAEAAAEIRDIIDEPSDARFGRLTRLAERYFEADVAFVTLFDSEHQWMLSATDPTLPPRLTHRESICSMMKGTGEPLVIGDIATDDRVADHPTARQFGFGFYAGAPLLSSSGAFLGSLCVMRRESGDAEAFDIAALVDFAGLALDEIELSRRNRELERLSTTDALTGLANRRAFEAALDRTRRRSRRTGWPLSLLLIDVDHFKALNDSAGHEAGDEALRRLGALLADIVRRPDDLAARHGGEEFVLLLPDTDAEGALLIAERLRDRLAAEAIEHPGIAAGRLTLSIGIATATARDAVSDPILRRADAALYRAKREGRDRIVVA